jgi:hypothetical protein
VAAMTFSVLVAPRDAFACRFLDEPDAGQSATQPPKADPEPPKAGAEPARPDAKPPLDFELLDEKRPAATVDEAAIRWRRTLLTWHQGVGLGMFGLALANTVVGQLNYSDRFASGASTGRYQLAHQITAYSTVLAFTGTGLLALFAPTPLPKTGGFDRVSLHKLAMGAAAAGMAAEVVLGIYTASREGYLNQPDFAAVHLAIGYVTFAAITLGVGTIVF